MIDASTSTALQRTWTAFYALTLLVEAVGLWMAALVRADEWGVVYLILPYTGAAVVLILGGVLSLAFTSTRLLRRLIWVKASVLVVVWAVLILGAPDPYLPGSCADVQTGCIPREAEGARAR